METDKIMFLPVARDVRLDGAAFRVLEEFDSGVATVQSRLHGDGFVYPPIEPPSLWLAGSGEAVFTPSAVRWNVESLAARPAPLHRLPSSHRLEIYVEPVNDNIRVADGVFLMHLTAYLYGIRLQFHDWWFDGRIPMKTSHHVFVPLDAEYAFLSHAYEKWRSWKNAEQNLFINTLYMHSRAPTHEWDWECFSVNYTVFDAIYRLGVLLYKLPESKSHKTRLYDVCNQFGVSVESHNLEMIYELRNPLIHEGIWLNQQPGTAIPDDYWRQVMNLQALNQRLIASLLGFRTSYVSSSWSSLSLGFFDSMPPRA